MRLTLRDVYAALDYGAANGGDTIVFTGISTDTRTLQPGDLFVALTGPTTDGHQHIAAALRGGAAGLIVSQNVVASLSTPVLRVPDTQIAYGLLARYWRDQFDIPVIGVTGSVGKTTVKEMLAAALSPLGPVLKTAASQNNETGVPKALLQLTPEHKAAVIEMGMRGSGQIAYLCGIARPTVGVITVIADNHLELLGSLDAIADAKGELLEALPEDGLAILNAADPYYPYLEAKTKAEIAPYGILSAADIQQTETGWKFTVRGVPVEIRSLSQHDIGNALAALTVAEALGVSLEAAAEALRAYAPPPMRMNSVKTEWGGTVLNDAYNAAPASVATALQTLASSQGGRKIAFLGDMRELGTRAEEAHRELGPIIAGLGGLDALYTVGGLAALIPDATQRFADSDEAARFVREAFAGQPGDTILVKGSRAMTMEKVAVALEPTPARSSLSPPETGRVGVGAELASDLETLRPPVSGGPLRSKEVGS
ncbi:MAG: UDP-N-acetylmuramoyl-tripeptide--D-alanyl-D-alanine ligase [Janthinobacterium lividum]